LTSTKQRLRALPPSKAPCWGKPEHIESVELPAWNAIIGLRNRIVHDYMNIDMDQVTALVAENKEQFVVRFLLQEPPKGMGS